MVDQPTTSAPAHLPAAAPRTFTVWLNALAGLAFIAMMVLPLEAAAAWFAGAALHSVVVGWVVAGALVLPTAWWLGGRGLRNALNAEAELHAIAAGPLPPQA